MRISRSIGPFVVGLVGVVAMMPAPSAGALGSGNYNGGTCTLKYSSFANDENVIATTSDASTGTNCTLFGARAFRGTTYTTWQYAATDAVRVVAGTSGSPRGGNHVGCAATCGTTKTS